MRGLNPPLRLAAWERAPERLVIEGSDLASAASRAASLLFAVNAAQAPRVALAVFVLVAVALAALPRPGGARRRLAGGLSLGAVLAAAVAVAFLAAPRPVLFHIAFPGGDPQRPTSGVLERRVERHDGYLLVSYAAGQSEADDAAPIDADAAILVGLSVPPGQGIPLEAFASRTSLLRLSPPPFVYPGEGGFFLSSDDFLVGWMIGGND
jgi:hypothetical protein